ncbi:hypothetical protein ACV356_32830, partial [Pseudomonas aeruginosa]
RFAQRQLAALPLGRAVVRAAFARARDFALVLGSMRECVKAGAGMIEQRATLALLMSMFRRPPWSIREIERRSGLSKSTL